jgi:hypothetical protein
MTVVFRDSRTHAYTYLLPMMVVAGLGVDTLIGWAGRLPRLRGTQAAKIVSIAVFLSFGYLTYSVQIDHRPEFPWFPKQVLGMQLWRGARYGNLGFPYSRRWRQIGGWFAALPRQHVKVVTNERKSIARFYLPSKVELGDPYFRSPSHQDEPGGLYFLVVQGPLSWQDRLWGWTLEQWRKRLVPVRQFRNADGQVVASLYFLSQRQLDQLFP